MKIDSKKLMFALIALTSVVLIILIVIGLSIGGRNTYGDGDEQFSNTPSSDSKPVSSSECGSDDTSDTTNAPNGIPSNNTGIQPQETFAASTETTNASYETRSGRIESVSASPLLSLVIDWETISRTSEHAEVKLTIKVRSYSIFVSARRSCPLEILGGKYTFDAPAINYDGKERIETVIGEQIISMPLVGGCGSAAVYTAWNFHGEYAGVPIEALTLDGFIEIKD